MSQGKPDSLYPDTEQLLADITDTYRDTIRHFYDLGCRSLQLDDTIFGRISTDAYTKHLLMGGIDVMTLQEVLIALTNACIDGVPADMHISIFISGGDTIVPSWQNVDYADDVIPKALSRLKVAQFYLPFDGKHAKSLDALRFVPADKQVALGLIDAHTPWAYYSDRILGCIDAAQRYIAPQLLSITPKTGFKLSKYSEKVSITATSGASSKTCTLSSTTSDNHSPPPVHGGPKVLCDATPFYRPIDIIIVTLRSDWDGHYARPRK